MQSIKSLVGLDPLLYPLCYGVEGGVHIVLAHGLKYVAPKVPDVDSFAVHRDDYGGVDGTPAGPVNGFEVVEKFDEGSGHALDPDAHVPGKGVVESESDVRRRGKGRRR